MQRSAADFASHQKSAWLPRACVSQLRGKSSAVSGLEKTLAGSTWSGWASDGQASLRLPCTQTDGATFERPVW